LSSDEETLNNAIPEIQRLVEEKWLSSDPALDLRLLIMTPSRSLYVSNGHAEYNRQRTENAMTGQLIGLQLARGNILDFFSKLEILVKEIVQANILGLFSPKVREFDQVLLKLNFADYVELLYKWRVIKSSLKEKIDDLRKIRNHYAHSWSESDTIPLYKKDEKGNPVSLRDNIERFRKDTREVMLALIEIYMKEEVKHLGILLNKLGDYNTINVWSDITKERKSRGVTDEELD
jgi:hypothetical protein